jgi:ferritin-like metal-binding protein YciE
MAQQGLKDLYVRWLNDAYSMEQSIIQVLENHVEDAKDQPQLQAKLQEHLEQTRRHAEVDKGCLERLGESPSTVKSGMANVMGTVQGMVQAMSTGMMAQDELVKNGIADYATEHFEIASYKALIVAAQDLGDQESVRTYQEILRDEEAMANWFNEHLPNIVQETIRRAATTAEG